MKIYVLVILVLAFNNNSKAADIVFQYPVSGGGVIQSTISNISEETIVDMPSPLYEQLLDLACKIQRASLARSVHITSKDGFLEKEALEARIKRITFEGFTLDQDFLSHYCKVMAREFYEIKFINCSTDEGLTFADILDSNSVVDLGVISCSVSLEDLSEVLLRINPHAIKKIDISSNNFGESELFKTTLIERIHGMMCLDSLNLAGNGFSSDFIENIKNLLGVEKSI